LVPAPLAPESLAKALDISGALVLQVEPGGPAAQAGITGVARSGGGRWILGDLIESVDGRRIERGIGLLLAVEERKPGEAVKLGLLREGERRTVELILAPWKGPGHIPEAHRQEPP
jgi:S1-C subfamily serine protease